MSNCSGCLIWSLGLGTMSIHLPRGRRSFLPGDRHSLSGRTFPLPKDGRALLSGGWRAPRPALVWTFVGGTSALPPPPRFPLLTHTPTPQPSLLAGGLPHRRRLFPPTPPPHRHVVGRRPPPAPDSRNGRRCAGERAAPLPPTPSPPSQLPSLPSPRSLPLLPSPPPLQPPPSPPPSPLTLRRA